MSNELKGTMEAYLSMVSEKKLDPVQDAENDKKFKDRKDKDIDNDGDVDSSDEFLHKKRKAIDNAKDGGEKPATKEAVEDEEPKKKVPPKKDGDADEGETEAEKDDDDAEEVESDGEGDAEKPKKKEKVTDKNPKTADKTAEISKIGEAFAQMWAEIEEANAQKKGATAPEGLLDKESPKSKEFVAKHKVDKIKHDDLEKVEEPKERTVKKEMKEYEVIRAILSGKPIGE